MDRRVSASQGRNERQDIARDCQEQDRERTRNEQRDEREQPSLVPSHSHNAQSQSDNETQQAQRPYKGRNRTASARAQDDQQRQDPGEHLQDKSCHRAIAHGRSLQNLRPFVPTSILPYRGAALRKDPAEQIRIDDPGDQRNDHGERLVLVAEYAGKAPDEGQEERDEHERHSKCLNERASARPQQTQRRVDRSARRKCDSR